jgi:hypothetical protein
MRIAFKSGPRELSAIQQGGVIETILINQSITPHQSGQNSQIGHITRREKEYPIPPQKIGEFLLKLVMR